MLFSSSKRPNLLTLHTSSQVQNFTFVEERRVDNLKFVCCFLFVCFLIGGAAVLLDAAWSHTYICHVGVICSTAVYLEGQGKRLDLFISVWDWVHSHKYFMLIQALSEFLTFSITQSKFFMKLEKKKWGMLSTLNFKTTHVLRGSPLGFHKPYFRAAHSAQQGDLKSPRWEPNIWDSPTSVLTYQSQPLCFFSRNFTAAFLKQLTNPTVLVSSWWLCPGAGSTAPIWRDFEFWILMDI